MLDFRAAVNPQLSHRCPVKTLVLKVDRGTCTRRMLQELRSTVGPNVQVIVRKTGLPPTAACRHTTGCPHARARDYRGGGL